MSIIPPGQDPGKIMPEQPSSKPVDSIIYTKIKVRKGKEKQGKDSKRMESIAKQSLDNFANTNIPEKKARTADEKYPQHQPFKMEKPEEKSDSIKKIETFGDLGLIPEEDEEES